MMSTSIEFHTILHTRMNKKKATFIMGGGINQVTLGKETQGDKSLHSHPETMIMRQQNKYSPIGTGQGAL